MSVEPPQIPVPIEPQYLQPDTSDPTNPGASYVYTAKITISFSAKSQPVLADGTDYAKLLVFAKSTESGLYKSGYGIKELRVAPAGAVHESDVASSRPKFTPIDVPPQAIPAMKREQPGLAVAVTPPPSVALWTPQAWQIAASKPGTLSATLLDETGAVVYASGPRDSADGKLALNLTMPDVGRFLLAVHAESRSGEYADQSFAFPFDIGPTTATSSSTRPRTRSA
jgi:hypothetical protein